MLKIGDIHVHVLNDATVLSDPGGPFGLVPKVLWSRHYQPTPDGYVPMVHNCLLVQAAGKNILVDTGYGSKFTDKSRRQFQVQHEGGLIAGLQELGIAPNDIEIVINTHLHSDHCNGNTRFTSEMSGEVEPVFRNAVHIANQREYQDAMKPNERTRATYFPYNYQPLVESGQMRLVTEDTEVVPGVRCVITPGHTPGHMSVVIQDGGESGLFVCDMASFAIHFAKLGWMTAFDVEPLVTLETKRIWQKWAREHDAILFFPHDAYTPAARLGFDDKGRYSITPVLVPGYQQYRYRPPHTEPSVKLSNAQVQLLKQAYEMYIFNRGEAGYAHIRGAFAVNEDTKDIGRELEDLDLLKFIGIHKYAGTHPVYSITDLGLKIYDEYA